ncbi:MAG: carboxypeptidase regulatory-like domain-containing protein, partial [Candidatus Accumulibacter sp.]|uniref:SdrD B-like domain-containing protein n=1 Tax=Accumulibacter sp. TaxID=2053492 RepID=UPI001AD31E8B
TVFTGQNVGNDTSDSDADTTTGKTQIVTLAPGEHNPTLDAGVVIPPASLGDRLWLDSNANGQQDDGATGISGQTVTLIGGGTDGLIATAGDNTTATTTTGTDGFYEFTGLTPGVEYQVQFAAPAGTVFTGQNVGNDASDSDADTTTGKTQIVTLGSGEHNPTLDAGVYVPASLGDRLWLDSNANGQQDDGATGISGKTVTLMGGGADGLIATAGDNTTATTTTGTDGFYQFTGLKPGVEYQVQFAAPAGTVFTGQNVGNDASDSDADTTTGKTQIVTLGSGEHNPTLDAGVILVTPKIDIEKTTNGPSNSNATAPDYDNEDAANGAGVPVLTPGSSVTWTYKVTNTGNVAFAKNDVAIVDDNGTTGNTADDLSVANGKITYQSGDTNTNNLLDPGEAWLYKATGTVQNLTAAGAATTFDFSGSSATDGSDGNVRTFTSGALSVKTSAFSRDQSTGTWAQAYLGSYGGGLGVTDSSESGSGDTHTVDNLGGRDNYVLFEFNQNVVVDSAFLGYVVGDSDMSVWIGTRSDPFNNHDTMLSDADLTALGFTEVNLTDLSSTRLADLNAGNVSGNVLVISGWTGDTTPEDRFKIENLTVRQSSPGVYENKATVTAPGATSDSDLSHYKNPAAQPILASLGDRVWEDLNANGVQDTGENGISGVTVKLLNSSDGTVATTTTNASGNYLFSNLTPGDYKVQVVAPTGYYVSPKDQGGNDATDSDIDSTTGKTVLTTLISGENDLSWDAGLYRKASVGDKVWDDMDHDNVQDASEPGIKGITVKLMNAAGTTVLATTTTNSSGNYLFSNLDPGTYVLQFDKTNVQHYNYGQWNNMSNWKWAVKDTGSNDSIDSDVAGDAIATTNVTKTSAFTLVSGQNDLTRDAGITPIAIDLDGNGIQTVSRADSGGSFDLFGNGGAVASGWLSGGDGFLAVDKNGNGKVDSISELFGGTAKGAGFAQLAEYDSNGDGLVNAADAAFADLRIWRDANGNHQTDDGELMTLAEAGVSELATAYTELPFLDRQGNVHLERSSATMSDGQTVDMTDVYFSVAAQDAAAAGVTLTGIAELLNANGGQTPVDAGWLFS